MSTMKELVKSAFYKEHDVVISIKENNLEIEICLCKNCYKKYSQQDFCSFCKTKEEDTYDKKLYNYRFVKRELCNSGKMCINCKEEGKFQDTKERWEFHGWKELQHY